MKNNTKNFKIHNYEQKLKTEMKNCDILWSDKMVDLHNININLM